MVLSVLPVPTKGYGLWDDSQNKFLHIGTSAECFTLKNTLETEEQGKANRLWKSKIIERQFAFLTKAGLPEENAMNIIKKNFANHPALVG